MRAIDCYWFRLWSRVPLGQKWIARYRTLRPAGETWVTRCCISLSSWLQKLLVSIKREEDGDIDDEVEINTCTRKTMTSFCLRTVCVYLLGVPRALTLMRQDISFKLYFLIGNEPSHSQVQGEKGAQKWSNGVLGCRIFAQSPTEQWPPATYSLIAGEPRLRVSGFRIRC